MTNEPTYGYAPAEPILELPKRRHANPGRPRLRTFIDCDGDLWQSMKGNGDSLTGIEYGAAIVRSGDEVRNLYGPLVELDSVNISTAIEGVIEESVDRIVGYVRQLAQAQVHNPEHRTERETEAAKRALTEVAEAIEGFKR